jgi:hypothetical protein
MDNWEGRGRYNAVKVRLDGREITVLIVEFDSNPLRSRKTCLCGVGGITPSARREEIILMGDF